MIKKRSNNYQYLEKIPNNCQIVICSFAASGSIENLHTSIVEILL